MIRVAMLGSFPPQAQGISEYCGGLAAALSHHCELTALGFRHMYPSWLFPGEKTAMDPSKRPPAGPHLTLRHTLAWYNPLGWVWAALRTPADVFHLQWWSLPLFPVAVVMLLGMKLRGKPVVVTVHNVLPHERSRGFVAAGRFLCRRADRVIVHSEQNERQLIGSYGIGPERVLRIPMGATLNETPPVARAEARTALGLPANAEILLSFGTIRPYKGIDDLIEAFARVAEERSGAHLVIAGKPWMDWEPYRRRIEELALGDRIHCFLEYIRDERVGLFFSAADLVVLPYTHFDAQSAVGARALPYRKPMIVSDVGGLPDWVGRDPRWVVPAGDSGELAARILTVLGDTALADTAFGPIADRVLAENAWANAAKQHAEAYAGISRQ